MRPLLAQSISLNSAYNSCMNCFQPATATQEGGYVSNYTPTEMDQHLDFLEFRENGELLLGTSSLNRRSVPSLPPGKLEKNKAIITTYNFDNLKFIPIYLPKWPEKRMQGSLLPFCVCFFKAAVFLMFFSNVSIVIYLLNISTAHGIQYATLCSKTFFMSFCRILPTLWSQAAFHNIPQFFHERQKSGIKSTV